jgi:predicted TIM-barrel fold metal-dependent hydrolase
MNRIDIHTHLGVDLLFYFRGGYPYALDLPTLVADGRRSGLDRWVVFPMVTHTGLSLEGLRAGRIAEPEQGPGATRAPYAWENRRLLREVGELFPGLGRHALPFLMIDPSRHPGEQVKELRALRNSHTIYGLKIQATIIRSPIRSLLKEGSGLLDFAEAERLPVLIHTSVHPEDRWSQVTDILEIVRNRPGIRFCLAHSCRFDRAALDQIATLPNAWFDCSAHVIHCRLAMQNNPAVAAPAARFPSDYRNPSQVLADLARAYPDRLLWGSDAPFHSYVSTVDEPSMQMVCSYGEEARALRDLPEEVQERISFRNSLAFLGLSALPA